MNHFVKYKLWVDQRSLTEWSLFFLLINLILRFIFVTVPDVQLDEPFSIYYASVSWNDLWEMMKTENSPPLHFIFMKCWTSVAGFSVFALRTPSVLFTSFAVVFVVAIGEKFFHKYTGVFAAALYTCSTIVMYHSHEVRVYGLFIFLSAASFYVFFKYQETEKVKYVLIVGLLNTLLVYSHFIGWFVIGIQGLSVLISSDKNFIKTIKKCFLLCIPVLGYLPYIAIFFSRVKHLAKGTWIDAPTIHDLYKMFYKSLNAPLMVIIFFLLLITYIIYGVVKKQSSGIDFKYRVVAVLWWTVPLIGLWFYSFYMPFYLSRYVAFGIPGLCLYLSFMLLTLHNWFPKPMPYVILTVLIIFLVRGDLVADGGSSLKGEWDLVMKSKNKNNSVVIVPSWYNKDFAYYYEEGASFRKGTGMVKSLEKSGIYSFTLGMSPDSLAGCCLKNEVIVFHFMDDDFEENRNLLRFMNENYKKELKLSDRVSIYKK